MKLIKVEQGQNILDILIQYYGSIKSLFSFTDLNQVSITKDVEPGSDVKVEGLSNGIVSHFRDENIIPATTVSIEEGQAVLPGGIGYMGIEIDFIIS